MKNSNLLEQNLIYNINIQIFGVSEMDEILHMNTAGMAGLAFDCSCGLRHRVNIEKILTGRGVISGIPGVLERFRQGKVLLIADDNTYGVCGCMAEKLLQKEGFNVKKYVYHQDRILVPDEKAVGRLLIEVDRDTSVMVAVGSGTINDMTRFISCKTHIPYIIVGTAPSMDGYASVVSPLIVEGFKVTYDAVAPYAIIADTGIMKDAPIDMIRAGFGDIIGKYTALGDWNLSRKLNGEYYCETSAALVRNALQKCVDNAEGMARRDEKAIEYLTEALILSGIAMGLVGNSRPASGAEHHLAHYWEIDALAKGKEHPLHGNSVGAGAVVISSMYELMSIKDEYGIEVPSTGVIAGLLERTGGYSSPARLGISRELFKDSLAHAMEIRTRYTILRLASEKGLLKNLIGILDRRFYG
jgi:glycerol-1-phosphate dehydrogenase [NAD(P)+]